MVILLIPNIGNDENGDEIESFYQKIIEDGKFKVYDNGWKDVTFTVFKDNDTIINTNTLSNDNINIPIEQINFDDVNILLPV